MNASELKHGLSNFWGSETFTRHPLNRRVVYTEGAKFFFDNAGNGAYWLLDILATEPAILKEAEQFTHVTLTVAEHGGVAHLNVTDGGKEGDAAQSVYHRRIDWTDCPPGDWEFFFENMTVMLPGER